MPKRAEIISADGKSTNDFFAKPKHQQSMNFHRHDTPPRRKSQEPSSDATCEQARKRSRRQSALRKEHQPEKNLEPNQQSCNDLTNGIFADPNEQQQTNEPNLRHLRPKLDQSTDPVAKYLSQQPECPQNKKNHKNIGRRKWLQCQEINHAIDPRNDESFIVLNWNSPIGYVPLSEENTIVEFMFQRNGKKEWGMMKGKPSFVVGKYKKALRQHAPSMSLPQALSLRRHHIKLLNQSKNMQALGLGSFDDIKESARIFERAVEIFLRNSSIDFLTEEAQRKAAKEQNEILRATPDFILPKPVLLRKMRKKKPKKGRSTNQYDVVEERIINWIEAKMYYGASSIPHGSKGAVGTVLSTARKYLKYYGEGAILFMMGCGDKLAADLNDAGVSVLDCAGNTVCLDPVQDHQRTWCADENGQILP